tara:strand:- start:820 stop:1794 length:975 start_codon:yes stop_codon:yes gene_type:complete
MSKQEINKDTLRAVLARMALNNPKLPTKEAAEARRILQSIKDTKALKSPYGADYYNTVLDTRVELSRTKPHGTTDIAFKTDGGYDRPDVPNTRVRRLGIAAQLNRAIDDLPTARDGTGRSAYYEAIPMTDQKDYKKMSKSRSKDNQRAKLYRRMSKGAMDAVPDRFGNLSIQGERISDDTFQPRGEKGRVKKHVKWNLAEPVKRLDKIGRQLQPMNNALSIVSNIANRANPYLLAADLIQQDIRNSTVADGTLEGRSAYELGFQGPPDPKPKTKSKPVIKAPPKKNTAVLAKKGGKTGSSINGLFIAHPWSAEQRNRYAARGGK